MADRSQDSNAERAYLPVAAPPANHGNTVASWVTVCGVLLGAIVSAVAVVAARPWLFFTGLGVVVVALIVGRVLKMLGFGQPGRVARDTH
ncbi:MAG TPA: HGxxPAAW family protein [Actinotalea sp.]|jgi:hypothetical protein